VSATAARRRYAILAPDMFSDTHAKTAHGVIAYADDATVAVIDPILAGKTVRDAVPYLDSDAPIVASVAEALRFEPTSLLVGVAPPGGALPAAWRGEIVAALDAGLEVVSGLHQILGDDPEFEVASRACGASIWDVRTPPAVSLFSGAVYNVAARVVLTVGSDCAVGKMTVALELMRAARAEGVRAGFVATGQTGIMIAGRGIAIDRVIADFASGAAEAIVLEAARDADLLFVEGQGGINHPAFAAVTLAIVFGAGPDALVLVHRPSRVAIENFGTPLLSYRQLIRSYEGLCATVKPARVAGIALNTQDLDEPAARREIARAKEETGLPADDVVRFGPRALYQAMAPAFVSKTRPLTALLLALVAAVAISACSRVSAPSSAGQPNPWTIPGHLRIGIPIEPDNINPLFGHTDATDQIDTLIFAPMFRYDPHGEFVPELATEVPSYANGGISRDSKTITLHFRPGVTWSDGVPLTARDLRFTWKAVMNPRNSTKTTFGWDGVATIDVPDDQTAVVHLKRPDADALGLFGSGGSAYPPLPEHLLGKLPDLNQAAFNAHPISSGPWLLKEWRHGTSFEFVPNPRYWRGPPKLRAISMRFYPNPDTLFTELQTHDIDLIANVAETVMARLGSVRGITTAKHLIASWRRLAINCSRPALSDARVRLALAEAIDWDRMNATVYHGYNLRARSDIPPDSWAAPSIPFYPHDLAAAQRLLDAAGWRRGPDGVRAKADVPLELTISATNAPGNEEAEVSMQQQLRAIGVRLSIKNYPGSLLFAQHGPLYGGTYDLEWSIETNAPDPDNQASWSADFIPPRGANTAFIRDAILTRVSEAARRTFDRAKRKALYQQEEARIHALVPMVFFYWENSVAAYNSDLRNYKPAEYISDFWNSWEWSI
jgi:uncharacterized NAD-dependent epimerase/dehydratase family protein/ABC-type transport system substrate-binding protein